MKYEIATGLFVASFLLVLISGNLKFMPLVWIFGVIFISTFAHEQNK